MSEKNFPLTKEQLDVVLEKIPTPFHIYDEKGIRGNARDLKSAFSWLGNKFKEYFAVKACPNPYLMKITQSEGFGADCSSLPELLLSEQVGIVGEDIMFTSNETPAVEFMKAKELGAVINLDDITHISYLEKNAGLPELISFRYNPGPLRGGNSIIGNPEEAKYGLTKDQLFEAFKVMKEKGTKRFGLHTMVASNELNPQYFVDTADMLVELVQEISQDVGIKFDFINIGGGIGIPYSLDQEKVDLKVVSQGVKKVFDEKVAGTENKDLKLYMENGRMITGPYGWVVSKAVHKKDTYRNYVGLDACMANLMRPALYDSYHHISVMGKEEHELSEVYDVVGSLCENNDKFAKQRKLPVINVGDDGDIVVIHDTGAHGHAMGFNYNGKLRSAEYLIKFDGNIQQIRRAENIDDLFATLDFSKL